MSYYKESITNSGTIEVTTGNFVIDGTFVVPSPSRINCEYHVLSRAWKTTDGEERSYPLRMIRKVTFSYECISNDTFCKIKNYLMNKLINDGTDEVTLKTLFIGYDGTIDMLVRFGSPINPKHLYGDKNKQLVSCEFSFIEPKGTKINSTK